MGKLFDLIMLDTCNYDRSVTKGAATDAYLEKVRDDASRTLVGSRQENWFYNSLSKSKNRGAVWRIIGNQIIFSRIMGGSWKKPSFGGDKWDGYTANRNRTLAHLYGN